MLEQSDVPGSVREIGDGGMRNGSHGNRRAQYDLADLIGGNDH
jgi:hypothetical protein